MLHGCVHVTDIPGHAIIAHAVRIRKPPLGYLLASEHEIWSQQLPMATLVDFLATRYLKDD